MSWNCDACGYRWDPFMVILTVFGIELVVAVFAEAPPAVFAGICAACLLAAVCVTCQAWAARRLALARARAEVLADVRVAPYSSVN